MIKLDITILDDVGLGDLDEDVKKQLFQTFVESLELSVGSKLSDSMSDEQMNDFMKLIDSNKQEEARQWLEDNSPQYKEVVKQELERLKDELKENAEEIRASLAN